MKRDSILVVDDEVINRMILEQIFKPEFNILHAENGLEAIEVVKTHYMRLAAILLDIEMPKMNGFEFLAAMDKMQEGIGIPVIVVTADNTSDAQLKAYEHGVADIIKKPYNPKIAVKRVNNIVSLYAYQRGLESAVERQAFMLEEQERNIARINENLLDTLSAFVEFRDSETGEHVLRIKTYTKMLGEKMMEFYPEVGLTEHSIKLIASASSLHDIGKICIPDAILLKPGKLTGEEFEVIKTHTLKGAKMLDKLQLISGSEYLRYCRNICMYHHEKYDGGGYPEHLKGDNIPIEAQLVSIADVFDALVSKRVYKEAITADEAAEMIRHGECGMFSDKLLRCFDACFEDFKQFAYESACREAK